MKGDERKWGKESKGKGARIEKMERIQNTTFNNNTRGRDSLGRQTGQRCAGRGAAELGRRCKNTTPVKWSLKRRRNWVSVLVDGRRGGVRGPL